MSIEAAIIETENLTKHFWRHDAVNGVNLSVPAGATYALIGANGAGKTTTLRMLVNLLRPDQGVARVLGIDSRQLKPRDFLRIGYVSENQELPTGLTVESYFEYLRVLYPNWDRALEKDLRRQFALPQGQAIGKLSHGMRMKMMLAATLSFRPKLLILDEPLSGLDPLTRDEVMEGLLKQADETTIVISSHELSEIEGCTTHVAFMVKGRLLFQESIEEMSARFREVTVTFGKELVAGRYAESWLSPEAQGMTLRFVDAAFASEEALQNTLTAQFGAVSHYEALPMSLREISKALMRATRSELEQ